MIRTTVALLALVVAASAPLAAQQVNIVYIDSERLGQEATALQQARQQVQQQMQQLEAEADSALAPIQAQLQQLVSEFQQQQGVMQQGQREQRETAIRQKQSELQQAGSEWEQRAGQIQNEILGPALNRVNQVIDELRAERGYSFILDTSAGGVIAADPALDITDEVLRRLNS